MCDLNKLLADDIFVADGGVDDFQEMTDAELSFRIARYLNDWADTPDQFEGIIDAVRSMSMPDDDPFSTAVGAVKDVLEVALDDGVSGSMNETEYAILEKIAAILTQEANMPVEPRHG